MVRAFVSHQCGPGSIPGPGVIFGLSLLSVLVLAPRGISPGIPDFPRPALIKNQHFQIPIRSGANEHVLTSFRAPKCFLGKQITFIIQITKQLPFLVGARYSFMYL